MREIDGLQVYDPGEHPLQQKYWQMLLDRYPGWKISGPYCPGLPHGDSYMVEKDGVRKMVHVKYDCTGNFSDVKAMAESITNIELIEFEK